MNEMELFLSPEFDEKLKIGENDSYICHLIRNDSIEKYVIFVNQTNLNLLNKVIHI